MLCMITLSPARLEQTGEDDEPEDPPQGQS